MSREPRLLPTVNLFDLAWVRSSSSLLSPIHRVAMEFPIMRSLRTAVRLQVESKAGKKQNANNKRHFQAEKKMWGIRILFTLSSRLVKHRSLSSSFTKTYTKDSKKKI